MLVVRGFIAVQDRSPRLADAFPTRNEMSSDVLHLSGMYVINPKPSGLQCSNIPVIHGKIEDIIRSCWATRPTMLDIRWGDLYRLGTEVMLMSNNNDNRRQALQKTGLA